MDEIVESAMEHLSFANLSEKQEKELRKFEKKFNEEFGSELYFMVFDREKRSGLT